MFIVRSQIKDWPHTGARNGAKLNKVVASRLVG